MDKEKDPQAPGEVALGKNNGNSSSLVVYLEFYCIFLFCAGCFKNVQVQLPGRPAETVRMFFPITQEQEVAKATEPPSDPPSAGIQLCETQNIFEEEFLIDFDGSIGEYVTIGDQFDTREVVDDAEQVVLDIAGSESAAVTENEATDDSG